MDVDACKPGYCLLTAVKFSLLFLTGIVVASDEKRTSDLVQRQSHEDVMIPSLMPPLSAPVNISTGTAFLYFCRQSVF